MRSLCVFCGSSTGDDPAYASAAGELAVAMVAGGMRLVYGGGSVGLMGIIADAMLAAGGEVVGVIPRALWEREVGHRGLTDLRIVETMHERKALMAEVADGFVAMPGGIGTLEEFFEVWTWAQLGVHGKPCGLLNSGGYYDSLLTFIDQMVARKLLKGAHREMVIVEREPRMLLQRFAAYRAPSVAKWIDGKAT
ncbi:MAG: TIGR00730 family Rossman fold protein [Planctomycetota bacterium]